MKWSSMKIGWFLKSAFMIVAILVVVLGVAALIAMHKLPGLTVSMYDHPLAVSNAVREIKAVVLSENIGQIAVYHANFLPLLA